MYHLSKKQKGFLNINFYKGEIVDEKRNGFGLQLFPNGCYYIGFWKNNEANGYGRLVLPDSTKYEGDFYKNIFQTGTVTYFNKAVYEGQFDGTVYERFKNGIFKFSTGDKFVGEWNDGYVSKGYLLDPKGVMYKFVKNNIIKYCKGVKKDDYGIIIPKNSKWMYEGGIKKEKCQGKGVIFCTFQHYKEATFTGDKLDGFYRKVSLSFGGMIDGECKNDKKTGTVCKVNNKGYMISSTYGSNRCKITFPFMNDDRFEGEIDMNANENKPCYVKMTKGYYFLKEKNQDIKKIKISNLDSIFKIKEVKQRGLNFNYAYEKIFNGEINSVSDIKMFITKLIKKKILKEFGLTNFFTKILNSDAQSFQTKSSRTNKTGKTNVQSQLQQITRSKSPLVKFKKVKKNFNSFISINVPKEQKKVFQRSQLVRKKSTNTNNSYVGRDRSQGFQRSLIDKDTRFVESRETNFNFNSNMSIPIKSSNQFDKGVKSYKVKRHSRIEDERNLSDNMLNSILPTPVSQSHANRKDLFKSARVPSKSPIKKAKTNIDSQITTKFYGLEMNKRNSNFRRKSANRKFDTNKDSLNINMTINLKKKDEKAYKSVRNKSRIKYALSTSPIKEHQKSFDKINETKIIKEIKCVSKEISEVDYLSNLSNKSEKQVDLAHLNDSLIKKELESNPFLNSNNVSKDNSFYMENQAKTNDDKENMNIVEPPQSENVIGESNNFIHIEESENVIKEPVIITKTKRVYEIVYFEGKLMNNMMHGFCKLFLKNKMYKEGLFFKDKMEGFGTVVYPHGVQFQGNFVNDVITGPGILSASNKLYEGTFKNKVFENPFVSLKKNKTVIIGESPKENNLLNGKCTIFLIEGYRLEASLLNERLISGERCRLTRTDGQYWIGKIKDEFAKKYFDSLSSPKIRFLIKETNESILFKEVK